MALQLKKGGTLQLKKESGQPAVTKIRLGLGWAFKPGLETDLDASVLFLGNNEKMWAEDSLVFYHKLMSDDGAVIHQGDVRGEEAGGDDGDDEEITIDLTKVSPLTKSLLAVVTSYSDHEPVFFGRVASAYVKIYDESKPNEKKELATFDLSEDMSNFTAMTMGRLDRVGDHWEFHAVNEGVGKSANGLEDIIAKYGY